MDPKILQLAFPTRVFHLGLLTRPKSIPRAVRTMDIKSMHHLINTTRSSRVNASIYPAQKKCLVTRVLLPDTTSLTQPGHNNIQNIQKHATYNIQEHTTIYRTRVARECPAQLKSRCVSWKKLEHGSGSTRHPKKSPVSLPANCKMKPVWSAVGLNATLWEWGVQRPY